MVQRMGIYMFDRECNKYNMEMLNVIFRHAILLNKILITQ